MTDDERFMARALELAALPARTSPNPRVGAVVVRAGDIIAEAAHEGAGSPHAEARALDGIDARSATLYVNLEPCIHQGRTPPCAPAIVEAGVARVVVGISDPDERVAGKGLDLLRSSGVEVETGVCAPEASALNRPYLHHRRTGRPFVTLKIALSLDGKMAASDRSSRWITGDVARQRVHRRRLEVDAVLVGAGTAIADDPALTVRGIPAVTQPARVLCDASGRVPATARLFDDGTVLVMTTVTCPQAAQTAWKEAGAEVVVLPQAAGGGVELDAVFENLGARGWLEVYCEGGARLATSLLRAGLVDRLEVNYGPVLLGGTGTGIGDLGIDALTDAMRWRPVEVGREGEDVVVVLERGG